MNVALFRKTAHEHRWLFVLILFTTSVFPVIFVHAFLAFPIEQTEGFLKVPLVRAMIKALTGADVMELFSINALGAFAFVHPVMLALGWACVVVSAARVIAGEIDVGTADLLLALPVSRFRAYLSVTAWVFLCCPLLAGAAWFGVWMGTVTADMPEVLDIWSLGPVAVNSAAMLIAVAGVATLISAVSSRQGRAVGVAFGILLCSFLLNWLAAFWEPAQRLAFVGILRYFRPFVILREGHLQTADVAVLLAVALITWSIGAVVFTRRDVHTS